MRCILILSKEITLYSGLLTALGAVAQTYMSYRSIHQPHNYIVFIITGLLTFFAYNAQCVLNFRSIQQQPLQSDNKRIKFIRKYLRCLRATALLCAVSVLFLIPFLSRKQLLVLTGVSVMTALYYLPFFSSYLLFGFRERGVWKLLLIVCSWVFLTVLFPLADSIEAVDKKQLFLLITERMVFVALLALLCDLIDVTADQKAGLKTLAISLGVLKTKIIAFVLLFLYVFLHLQTTFLPLGVLGIVTVYTLLLIIRSSTYASSKFKSAIDGGLLIPYLGLMILR